MCQKILNRHALHLFYENQQQVAISSYSGDVLLLSLSGEQVAICRIGFGESDAGDS